LNSHPPDCCLFLWRSPSDRGTLFFPFAPFSCHCIRKRPYPRASSFTGHHSFHWRFPFPPPAIDSRRKGRLPTPPLQKQIFAFLIPFLCFAPSLLSLCSPPSGNRWYLLFTTTFRMATSYTSRSLFFFPSTQAVVVAYLQLVPMPTFFPPHTPTSSKLLFAHPPHKLFCQQMFLCAKNN